MDPTLLYLVLFGAWVVGVLCGMAILAAIVIFVTVRRPPLDETDEAGV